MEGDSRDCKLQTLNDTELQRVNDTDSRKNGKQNRDKSLQEAKTALRKFLETTTIRGVGKVSSIFISILKNSILTHQGSLFMDLPPISQNPIFS